VYTYKSKAANVDSASRDDITGPMLEGNNGSHTSLASAAAPPHQLQPQQPQQPR